MKDFHLKIAEAARALGVSPSTLRLWEQQGLIEPVRTPSGQRLYDAELLDRLKTIAWLRNEKGLNSVAIRESLAEEQPPAAPRSPDISAERRDDEMPVGAKLREMRRKSRQTLESVARATGTSVSQLSTFERTSQGLSVTALHAVAKHFGTTIAILSGQASGEDRASLVRNGEWTSWPTSSTGVTVHDLAKGNRLMQCNRFDLAPGASSEGSYQHEGEEFIYVLSGSFQIVLDGDQFYELHTGDSFYFESKRPHSWRNLAEGTTTLIWINTPATF
ncbi:MerR family transcriptional regulator [Daeguia caeni]|uniref:MerR family transcriptional regulator n=1 Tax=Daeguia caeni TaxID=439612 RepID=A0ABV9H240_9HYPH